MYFEAKLPDAVLPAAGGGDTGTQLRFDSLPDSEGGEVFYARRIRLSIDTDVQAGSGVAGVVEGDLLKTVSKARITIPDVGTIRELSGLDIHRLFRSRHGHIATTSPALVASSSTVTRRWQYIIEFAHPLDLKRDNGLMPVATLKRADFKVFFNTIANINANIAAFAGDRLVQAFVEIVTLKKKVIPTLYIEDTETPAINREVTYQEGWYTDALIVPDGDAAWTAAPGDYRNITAQFGARQVWPEQTDQRKLVAAWNARIHDQRAQAAGAGVMTPPVDATATVHDFIPILSTPAMEQGEGAHFFSSQNAGTRAKPKLTFNAAPTIAPRMIRCRIADHGLWSDVVRRDLQIPADNVVAPELAGGSSGRASVLLKAPAEDKGRRRK